jgi:hypothetical protein
MASVQSFSNPEAGARGDFSANVRFADLVIGKSSIGYGAAQSRTDEITIADGVFHLARPDGHGGFTERRTYNQGEGGYMVQLVTPTRWRAPVAVERVGDLDALGAAIAKTATDAGCGGNTKLAYRYVGRVLHAEWSLDTLPSRGDFTADNVDVVIVGLYANVDQQKHFVTPGRNIHAHVVFPTLGVAGHLKAASFASSGRLQLQGR